MSFITINRKSCKKDDLCIQECPAGIIVRGAEGFPEPDPEAIENCIQCGHCQAVCPCDALTLRDISPKDRPLVLKGPLDWEIMQGLIRSRRSVRKYKKAPIAPELLDKLFDVVRWAPTGGNSQLVKWLLVEKPETRKKISEHVANWARGNENLSFLSSAWEAGHDLILRDAPCLAIAYAGNEYGSTSADCVIATTTLELAASSQGLGACWAGFFMMACAAGYAHLLDLLQLPENNKVHAALMLGYPQYRFSRIPDRKPINIKRI
jgi:nitroreductase/NAD-dependent dihydropyrimidine dehydrogenase PreA subunit